MTDPLNDTTKFDMPAIDHMHLAQDEIDALLPTLLPQMVQALHHERQRRIESVAHIDAKLDTNLQAMTGLSASIDGMTESVQELTSNYKRQNESLFGADDLNEVGHLAQMQADIAALKQVTNNLNMKIAAWTGAIGVLVWLSDKVTWVSG